MLSGCLGFFLMTLSHTEIGHVTSYLLRNEAGISCHSVGVAQITIVFEYQPFDCHQPLLLRHYFLS